ncbi:uncharacterized protein N0V89_010626 [Didymosphaeria variabile]|uniref:Uncharacterized protein n=1 Tax=Didymosphaeria variabile TaxID=1932322 RepID=A0A9W8XD68_9PLEO|nr:uncharacterized protein N0V89_010626 [Didymosphaeria variabile]KAJ4346694.1 hypothetical protein N0V89_010626 [Didymosphaeria variabile]
MLALLPSELTTPHVRSHLEGTNVAPVNYKVNTKANMSMANLTQVDKAQQRQQERRQPRGLYRRMLDTAASRCKDQEQAFIDAERLAAHSVVIQVAPRKVNSKVKQVVHTPSNNQLATGHKGGKEVSKVQEGKARATTQREGPNHGHGSEPASSTSTSLKTPYVRNLVASSELL